jgi:8-oxo-dGTP diphosphatase
MKDKTLKMKNGYYQNLPKKRMGVGCLFFNDKNELMILKPAYKDHWSIPGGVIDENESPREACVREIGEEICFDLRTPVFICLDYISDKGKGESLQFIFYGGILNQKEVDDIKISKQEITEYKFLKVEKALLLLGDRLVKRIPKCFEAIKNNSSVYLENGQYV